MKSILRTVKGSELTHAEHDDNHKEAGSLGADVASAATVNLESAVTGRKTKITGTTTISSFGSAAHSGALRELEFAGAITLTHGASAIVCPGGVDLKLQSGDRIWVIHEGAGKWIVTDIMWASHKVRRSRREYKDDGASGTTKTIDFSEYLYHTLQATGACTLTFTAPALAQDEIILIVQGDGTQRAFTWPSTIDWEGGTAPTMPTATDDYLEVRGRYNGSRYHLTWGRFGY